MRRFRLLIRLLSIQMTLIRYGLDDIIARTHLIRPLVLAQRIGVIRRSRDAAFGERLRLALQELGPLFVKFGQALSVRRDLLPRDVADELAKLQDEVPPFPSEQAI